ncbi:CHAT domain-containing protein [Nocardia sp. CA2R105]|uniref:CHAT domain-containing protein n=1 Tax=Nocardia coffeae TaxID=2873381 RepID=UPI001CA6CBBB|nr:CHAT domain-containing protein [Nocardia coffeae]MBY8862393.1 CHAT domain-containing protein [Nocardia coffeae]
MSFDELQTRIHHRLITYHRSGQAETILGDEALAEANEVWQAAQPADGDHLTREDSERLEAARFALGWLHFLRWKALPSFDPHALARAIFFFEPLDWDIEMFPEPLRVVVGASAEARVQGDLAAHLLQHVQTSIDPILLHTCISLSAAAVAAAPPGHRSRAAMLSNLGAACLLRFGRGGVEADLDRAIEAAEQAVTASPPDHPDRANFLSNLGNAYRVRFEHRGVGADLDRAIETSEQALSATAADHPNRGICLSNLGGAYRVRFEHRGVGADLDRAIEIGEQAVAVTPSDHPDRAMRLSNLGLAYRVRFERLGVEADLDRAIEIGEQAVTATPPNHPDRAIVLSILGGTYGRRSEHRGGEADLDLAIELGEQARTATPADHPDRVMMLLALGAACQRRFERRGMEADLDLAIELGEQARTAMPPGRIKRAGVLSNLGGAYQRRFERRGVEADLDLAIDVLEQASADTSLDHPDRAATLSNLGNAYQIRFERHGVDADLDLAIETGEQAVNATPSDDPYRAIFLSSLSGTHLMRFERRGVVADLDRAIEAGEQAVAAIPADHPDRAIILSNLANGYQRRFVRDGASTDLDRAIVIGGQVIATTPPEHPGRAIFLSNLANGYLTRVATGEQSVDRETLHGLVGQVAATRTASPIDRIRVGYLVGSLALAVHEYSLAVQILDAAVALMPSMAPRESGWEDQEYRLGAYPGVVGAAVEAHCATDDPAGAVEVAELGRGVLLAAQLDSRTDLTDLDHSLPDLAARLRHVRELLNTPHTGTTPAGDTPAEIANRIEDRKSWWAEHDELLDRIRQYPGFDRFLRTPRLTDLQQALAGSTVILVNAGQHRGDAIILTSDGETVLVPLPDLAPADVASYARALLDASYDRGLVGVLGRQRIISEALAWLWDTIVHPILRTALHLNGAGGLLPRVWWLPTGLLGLFPLHAAGRPGQPGALDTIISSYTPTLRTLAHARTRPPATTRRQLTVALHHTPGQPDLPGTVAEATLLHADHPGTPLLRDSTATADRVLAELPDATWAHFACHAGIDFTAPSRSGLRLHDATLSLPEISRLQLTHAELAYLSACSTAHRGIQHADEALHPASAFQLAGFRHVIASLWPLADHTAATTATTFYQHLPPSPIADSAATALHNTVHELRTLYPDRPDLWAGLIHSGP